VSYIILHAVIACENPDGTTRECHTTVLDPDSATIDEAIAEVHKKFAPPGRVLDVRVMREPEHTKYSPA
jgi:hypothetical protein